MSERVRRFINSLPDKRAALQLLNALDLLVPTNKDTAITAYAGGGQTSATQLRADASFHDVTTVATTADSVALPPAKVGQMHFVKNSSANSMQVFAPTPDTIDSIATGTGHAHQAGDGVWFICVVDGNYLRIGGTQAAAKFSTGTTITTFAAGQLTGAANVTYENTVANPGSIATRTATQMFADDPNARVGRSYRLRINNNQGVGILTVTAGTGVTLTGTMTIAVNTYRDFNVTYTSATALVIQQIGIGTGA